MSEENKFQSNRPIRLSTHLPGGYHTPCLVNSHVDGDVDLLRMAIEAPISCDTSSLLMRKVKESRWICDSDHTEMIATGAIFRGSLEHSDISIDFYFMNFFEEWV